MVTKAAFYQAYSQMGDIDSNPFSFEAFGDSYRGAAAAKWIEYHIPFAAAGFDDPLKQRLRFLRGITQTLFRLRTNRGYVIPDILKFDSRRFIYVHLQTQRPAWVGGKVQSVFLVIFL